MKFSQAELRQITTQFLRRSEVVPVVNVKALGARGDADADDSAAIVQAIRRGADNRIEVQFPPGHYMIEANNVFGNLATRGIQAITFRGAGWNLTTLELVADPDGVTERWFYDAGAEGAFRYCVFEGINFLGTRTADVNSTITSGFRFGLAQDDPDAALNENFENGFVWQRCRFSQLHNLLVINGSANNDSHHFSNCRISLISGTVFTLNNSQSVNCSVSYSNVIACYGNIVDVGRYGGGDFHWIGSNIVMADETSAGVQDLEAPDYPDPVYFLHGISSDTIAAGNIKWTFTNLRFEFHGTNARLLQIEGTPVGEAISAGGMEIKFQSCNFAGSVTGGMREAVDLHVTNKHLVFDDCHMSPYFQYRITGEGITTGAETYSAYQAAIQGIPGHILFRNGCSVPRGFWHNVVMDSADNVYSLVEVRDSIRARSTTKAPIRSITYDAVDDLVTVSTGSTSPAVGEFHGLTNGQFTYIVGAGGFSGIVGPIEVDASDPNFVFTYTPPAGLTDSDQTFPDGSGLFAHVRYLDQAVDGSNHPLTTMGGMSHHNVIRDWPLIYWPDGTDVQANYDDPENPPTVYYVIRERTMVLPPNSTIVEVHLIKTARLDAPASSPSVQYNIGTDDKSVIFGSSTVGDQNVRHEFHNLNVWHSIDGQEPIRLWCSGGAITAQDAVPQAGDIVRVVYY